MVSVLSFPKYELSLISIETGNNLAGMDEFLSRINQHYLNSFKVSYDKFCDLLKVQKSFDHQFGTIILNAKLGAESMSYGPLLFRTQQNYSNPSTIDIHLVAPHYGCPDID